ncbi:phosphatidylcholine/phosphatidylserine synthase [Rhodovarius crocodyli]|uniref:Phosphatidylcholine/phosphatidylserine synthase n=1 Tax=Rhodovarius crocodyli TaxID=1979269 RepID=A0A437M2U4_9PROT|nr:phosphatidylcholine/phosphatidylserine synthase [Rhodovarius crocodyli]RVT91853.1 phosphatidylcholine/phosphatidylserine synthase [Rhodovarius crocodyli]
MTARERAQRALQRRVLRRPRYRGPSLNRLIPNILTMLGLCAGLVGIRFAFEGQFGPAAAMIVAAAVIDGLDGRIARLLKGTSPFGAEFDSLSDFLCFGVAPALILYLWSMQEVGHLFYLPCVIYAVCVALRLARFNAALFDDPAAPPKPAKPLFALNFFTGVPAPAAAGLVLFPLFAALTAQNWGWDRLAEALRHPIFVAIFLVSAGGLAISTLPAWSGKRIKVASQLVLPLMLAVLALATLLLTEPWAAITLCIILYAVMLALSVRAYRRLARAWEASQEATLEVPPT